MKKFLFKQLVELTGNPRSSKILKSFTCSRLSRPLIKPFANIFQINKSEMEYPLNYYDSLHAFFTRRLIPSARSIDELPNVLVSPVDAVLTDMGPISNKQTFYIKGRLYHMEEVFGNSTQTSTYENGYFYILYLSPGHYHRIHYPIDGSLISRYALGNTSFPVNNLGSKWGNKPFATNYRIISELATNYGKVAIVKVGALNINSIHLLHAAETCHKGEEIGYFSFGSTVIVFVEKNEQFKPIVNIHSDITIGQAIGMWEETSPKH